MMPEMKNIVQITCTGQLRSVLWNPYVVKQESIALLRAGKLYSEKQASAILWTSAEDMLQYASSPHSGRVGCRPFGER